MSTPSSDPPSGGGTGPEVRKTSLSKFVRRASKLLKPRSDPVELGTPTPTESKTVKSTKPPSIKMPSGRETFTSPAQYLQQREDKARALFAKYGMTLSADEWTSPSSGQTQWVEKKIVMRVHRQCHRCQTSFGREKVCFQCQHTRCKKCPRMPAKVSVKQPGMAEYDLDYSLVVDPMHVARGGMVNIRKLTLQTKNGREAVRKQPTQRVRRTCHRCSTLFMGRATTCENCKHERCNKCPRDPPKNKKWQNGYPGDVAEQFPIAERVPKPIRLRYRWECHTCNLPFLEHEKKCRGCGHDKCDECPRKPPKKVKKKPSEDLLKGVEEKIQNLGLDMRSGAEEAPVETVETTTTAE